MLAAAGPEPAQCKECHETTHKEWGQSFHARSVLWSLGSLRTFVDALEKERKAPTDKTQMLKCLDCHAPMVNDATEAVVKEIVGLIKTAVDDKDDGKKKAARDKLSALSVNCTGCHTVKGTGDPLKPARRRSKKDSRWEWRPWAIVTSSRASTCPGRLSRWTWAIKPATESPTADSGPPRWSWT